MLPKDIPGLSVPPESIRLSGWAPFVRLAEAARQPDRVATPPQIGRASTDSRADALRRAA
ncbi:MAG TPA: hypothetical protein VGN69_02005 [Solirubrobacteraceae bacterium]|jgi:hypothetical protein|nr:hypothetical protein [Solirubrobacteraceae bacterium]